MMIYIILTISVLVNTLLMWYGYKLVKKSLTYSENIYFLTDDMDAFVAHLEAIYELTTFYGDETLQHLLLHSKKLKEDIAEFKRNSILEVEIEEENKELIKYEESEKEATGA